ncbi:hypothetical protein GRI89_14455 [Altererythrobacter salegens]|uniref:Glucose-methanol-choline oxidoreductase C-terminal domain-containing protein n=1 Tax=Croceibacterium salegens TaxID=1737568 RepID=A0A6I4SXM3_9SPHN|nr:GMC family oxidoreductase [Croceibacterium salegens]MXO60741.1 hypothetical protein [Croceibacterium salegens]
MISNLSDRPDGTKLACDIVVIGAGAAGIAIAREFAGRSERVIVLEAGDADFDEQYQDFTKGSASGAPYFALHESRYRMLGGSTFRWGARTAPFKPHDFSERPWIDKTKGWPIPLDEITPFYDRVFQMVAVKTPFAFDKGVWEFVATKPVAFDEAQLEYHAFQFGRNLLFNARFGDELRQAPNVEVLLGAQVLEIDTGGEGAHVDHLKVAALSGGRCTLRAKTYILASGGIENARMLLLSKGRDGRGLANGSDTVGRFFMEHPTVSAGTITSSNNQKLIDIFSPGLIAGRLVEVGVALSPEQQRATQSLNAIARAAVVLSKDPTQALRELLRNLAHRRLPHNLSWYQKNKYLTERLGIILRNPFSIVGNVIRHALGKPKRFDVDSVYLELRTEQDPNPESRVTLGTELDAHGQPRAHLHWALTERDKHTMRTLAHAVDAELRRLGLGEIAFEPWLESDDLTFGSDMVGGHHHMGTTRMSADPADGVVRGDCRCHEVDNLYIAGSSLFPTSSFVNPTATLLALSIRLADMLKRTGN